MPLRALLGAVTAKRRDGWIIQWVVYNGGTGAILEEDGALSAARQSAGQNLIVWKRAFRTEHYLCLPVIGDGQSAFAVGNTKTVTSAIVDTRSDSGVLTDYTVVCVLSIGR